MNDSKEEETSGLKVMKNPTTYAINFAFRERRRCIKILNIRNGHNEL